MSIYKANNEGSNWAPLVFGGILLLLLLFLLVALPPTKPPKPMTSEELKESCSVHREYLGSKPFSEWTPNDIRELEYCKEKGY